MKELKDNIHGELALDSLPGYKSMELFQDLIFTVIVDKHGYEIIFKHPFYIIKRCIYVKTVRDVLEKGKKGAFMLGFHLIVKQSMPKDIMYMSLSKIMNVKL